MTRPSQLTGNSLVRCPDSWLWSSSSGTQMPRLLLPSWGSMLLFLFKGLPQTLSSRQHHLTSSKTAEAVTGPHHPQGISSMNPISNGSRSGSFTGFQFQEKEDKSYFLPFVYRLSNSQGLPQSLIHCWHSRDTCWLLKSGSRSYYQQMFAAT